MQDMAQDRPEFSTVQVSGNMFLYEKPELLTAEMHGDLGFTPPERPFEHVRNARAIPLNMAEFGSAQRHYPIIFTNIDEPRPLAITAVIDDENLFVDETGEWDPMAYVPSYLRCYPFTLVPKNEEQLAIVFDRAAASVSERPEYPFFVDGDKPSPQTQSMMDFCAAHERERRITEDFCNQLKELDLLAPYRSTHKPEGTDEALPIADYVSINVEKLNELPSDTVYDLHKTGRLVHIYMQVYSIENFRHLMARREQRKRLAA